MAGPKAKRRSRKRRNPGAAPRAVPSQRRADRSARTTTTQTPRQRRPSPVGAYGQRPPSPFGGLPVSEIAIFLGLIAVIVGWLDNGGAALIVGIVVCALGVIEVTGREHFSGYRSHTVLLAAIPAVAVEFGLGSTVAKGNRTLLVVPVVGVFALLFAVLRKRFQIARQARIARPPGA